MTFSTKSAGPRPAPIGPGFLKSVFVLALAVGAYSGMTLGARGPNLDMDLPQPRPTQFASLAYENADPVITGSVNHMFRTSGFVGPNRSDKTDRARPGLDLAAMAEKFNDMRVRLAARDDAPFDPAAPQSRVGLPVEPESGEDGPRMSLASVDPALASAALAAIEAAAPDDPSVPRPTAMPEELAYTRANTPSTERVINPYSDRERWCLAAAVYFEARGEPYRGQVGVAQVVMNRVEHRLYPDTICGVVFQNQTWRNRCQFSFACDGRPERVNEQEPWRQAREIADKVTAGSLYLAEVADATHYHASYVYPHWAPRMSKITRIGLHIFYRFRRG